MEPIEVQAVVRPLASWPDEQVQRAYRLSVAALRSLPERGGPANGDRDDAGRPLPQRGDEGSGGLVRSDLDDARDDAERYGLELVRRGLL